jgi:hypothetical protein
MARFRKTRRELVVEHVREHDDGAESEIPDVDTLQLCRADMVPWQSIASEVGC